LVVSVLSSLCHGGGLFVRILEKGGDRAYKALLNKSLGVMVIQGWAPFVVGFDQGSVIARLKVEQYRCSSLARASDKCRKTKT